MSRASFANAFATTRAITRAQSAYAEGWSAAEAWLSGDDDAPTRPPASWSATDRRAWIRGWSDAEITIDGDPND